MKKKFLIIFGLIILLIVIFLIIYPNIEFRKDNKLIIFSYSDDLSKYEKNSCYDDSFFYNEERNITFESFNIKKYFIFYVIIIEYTDGNKCENEFLLEEQYIQNFIENAVIKYNENNIDIKQLIKGKKAIVGNQRYNNKGDYNNMIGYILDGKHNDLYVFYCDDLLIIQVGNSDEGPKFIAYK